MADRDQHPKLSGWTRKSAPRGLGVRPEAAPVGSGPSPLAGHTLLAVFAHPDDESLACGGTFALCADAGVRIVILSATRGENGSISDLHLLQGHDLGWTREGELRRAADVLGVADLVVLDHPDGYLPWVDPALLQAEIRVAIRHFRPEVVVTFGADGLYWHPDHIAIHERTTAAVASLVEGAPALYYVTMADGAMRAVAESVDAPPGATRPATFWGIPADAFGVEAEMPTLTVDVRDYASRKLTAIRCHRSQMPPDNPLASISEQQVRELLGSEHFHRGDGGSGGLTWLDDLARGDVPVRNPARRTG